MGTLRRCLAGVGAALLAGAAMAQAGWRRFDPLPELEFSACDPRFVASLIDPRRYYAADGRLEQADARTGQWTADPLLPSALHAGEVARSVAVTRSAGEEVVAVLVQSSTSHALRVLWRPAGDPAWRAGPRFPASLRPDRGGCLLADPGRPERLFFWGGRSAGHHEADTVCHADRLDGDWRCSPETFGDGILFLVPDPWRADRLVLGDGQGGAWRSRDGGETFERLDNPIDPSTNQACSFGGSEGAAWIDQGVLAVSLPLCGFGFSEDDGSTWTIRRGPDAEATEGAHLGADPFDRGALLVDSWIPDPEASSRLRSVFYRSADRGVLWELVDAGVGAHELVADFAVDPARPFRWLGLLDGTPAVFERRDPSPCFASTEAGCLDDGRYETRALWRSFDGSAGVAHPLALTGSTGGFWFFDPGNLELAVRQIDGTQVNDRIWSFLASLSNVEFQLRVRDTASGAAYGFFNPMGRFASAGDVEALPSPAAAGVESTGAWRASGVVAAGAACVADATTLCLWDGRFSARGTWRDFSGGSGSARATPVSRAAGAFWFFAPDHLELVLKVLDGRPVNGSFWLFAGGLSNVEYEITVTDLATGTVQVVRNPAGTFASVGRVDAFPEP
jgi:hypothetical protein